MYEVDESNLFRSDLSKEITEHSREANRRTGMPARLTRNLDAKFHVLKRRSSKSSHAQNMNKAQAQAHISPGKTALSHLYTGCALSPFTSPCKKSHMFSHQLRAMIEISRLPWTSSGSELQARKSVSWPTTMTPQKSPLYLLSQKLLTSLSDLDSCPPNWLHGKPRITSPLSFKLPSNFQSPK